MIIEKLDSAESWYKISFKGVNGYGTNVMNAMQNCLDHVEVVENAQYDGSDEAYMQKVDEELSPVEFVTEY